ncbi:MAG TPA: sialidase family protein [Phycisphaerae bacterium]|nr:sialidase family protein [Phycisphaerae bacterium]
MKSRMRVLRRLRNMGLMGKRISRNPVAGSSATAGLMAALIVVAFGQAARAGGALVSSVQDGNWNDPTTWDAGVPDASLSHQVRIAHDILAPDDGQNANQLQVGWTRGEGTLFVPSGELVVNNGFYIGSQGNQGEFNVSGGIVQVVELHVGTHGSGLMTVSGGSLVANHWIRIGSSNFDGRLTIAGSGTTLELDRIFAAPVDFTVSSRGTLVIAPTADGASGLSTIDCNQETVNLNSSSTLELDTSSYLPSLGDSWTIFTDAALITGSFGSLVAPTGYALQQDITTTGVLTIEVTQTPCDALGGDSDHDGVCNMNDVCPGFDDTLDDDGDGIPNDCEADCNINGVIDDIDIAEGTSEDCNNNSVPDECDLGLDSVVNRTTPMALNTNADTDTGNDYEPKLATDGAGNWMAVWSSADDLGGTIGTDSDILYTRSIDNGTTWSAPAPLNSRADVDITDDFDVQVTTDGAGNWIAVWEASDPMDGTIGFDFDILYSRSTDAGLTWTAQAPLNSSAFADSGHDYNPQLTTDGAGLWIALWGSSENLGGTIGFDDDILYARSTDDGATWSTPSPLNINADTDLEDDGNVQLATDGAGNWIAVWDSEDDLGGSTGVDRDILVSKSTDGGITWTAPSPLNSNAAADTGSDRDPHLTTDSAGNWIAVWTSENDLDGTIGTDADIHYSRSTDAGATWTDPAPLNANAHADSGGDYRVQLTTDGAGNWVAVWESGDDLGGTIGTDFDVIYSRSTNDGVTWTFPAPLSTHAVFDSAEEGAPRMATDGAGNWLAAWYSGENLGGNIGTDYDIVMTRLTFSTTSLDENQNGLPDECDTNCVFGGDYDEDGDVDLSDYRRFEDCFAGPAAGYGQNCSCFDWDADGDVDLNDFAEFQNAFTGAFPD